SVTLYDGPRAPVRMRVPEFLGMWSGLGIIVSKSPSDVPGTIWAVRLLILQLGIVAVILLRQSLSAVRCRHTGFGREFLGICVGSCMLLLVTSGALGTITDHFAGVRTAAAPFVEDAFKAGTLNDVLAASESDAQVLIDARY